MNEIVNVITPFMMWLSDPQTIPAIINAIKGWYHWRLSKVYVPEGQEKHYNAMNKTIDNIFNLKGKKK